MRKLALAIVVMLLLSCTAALANTPRDVRKPDGIENLAINAWHEDAGDGMEYMCLSYIGSEADDITLRVSHDELSVYCEGLDEANAYSTADRWYDGNIEGQCKYVGFSTIDPLTVYIKLYCFDASVHNCLRITWDDIAEEWYVNKFDADTVLSYDEAVLAARLGCYDYANVSVQTELTGLNVRDYPGGLVIDKLSNGSTVVLYRCQAPAYDMDGTMFTLIAKRVEDENGWSQLAYYAWVASDYLVVDENTQWVTVGQVAETQWGKDEYLDDPVIPVKAEDEEEAAEEVEFWTAAPTETEISEETETPVEIETEETEAPEETESPEETEVPAA